MDLCLVLLSFLACMWHIWYKVDGACTIPSVFRESSWLDNVHDTVTFTTWKMSGWSFEVQSQLVDDWEIVDNTRFETGGYLAFRSLDTFVVDNKTHYSFLCLKFTKLTNSSYQYHILHPPQPLANSETVLLADNDGLTEFAEICNETFPYKENDYNVLLKTGLGFGVTCPSPILGKFEYTLHETDGSTVCPGVPTLCTSTLTFNLTACNYRIAYSDGGELTCVASTTSDGFTYIYVYNLDETVDNNTTFRFSCIVTEQSGRRLTISPTKCRLDQTPYKLPKGPDNTVIGQKVINHESSSCRMTEFKSLAQKSPFTVPVIVGICLGGSVLLCVIGATIFCFFRLSYNRMP